MQQTLGPRVLVVTLNSSGGVSALVEPTVAWLKERGCAVGVAWYEPYRRSPRLSVPLWALLLRRPRVHTDALPDGTPLHRVGVRLPELEANRYRAGAAWRHVVAQYDAVLAVCGSILPAGIAAGSGKPCLAWVATPFDADREARVHRFPRLRRWFDRLIDAPLCRRQERRLLGHTPVLALSDYTSDSLRSLQPAAQVVATLPWPLDIVAFQPRPYPIGPATIGFFGRFEDPRKNLPLLLDALVLLRAAGRKVTLLLAGQEPSAALVANVAARGLAESVQFLGRIEAADLPGLYARLRLFVIPSRQEGLGIVGVQALACGRPVVATRCGGPEEYVIDGETGRLVESSPRHLASAMAGLLDDPALAARMGERGARLVRDRYAGRQLAERFHAACDAVPALAPRGPTLATRRSMVG